MLKNIAASVTAVLCFIAVTASAAAQGMIDGIADAGKDVVDGIADAGRDIADGITGDGADSATGDGATGDGIIGGGTADDSGMGSDDPDPDVGGDTNSADTENSDMEGDSGSSDTVLGETDRPNPDTGVSFGYIASAAVLGALGVAVTVNKRRS